MSSSVDNSDAVAIELLTTLVSIRSHSGEEGEIQSFIASWFAERGLPAAIEAAADGLSNVVVEVNAGRAGPALWIGGHSDTVTPAPGWSTDPYRPVVKGNRLYGLGAMDMKGGLAAAMCAVVDLAERRDRWSGTVLFAALADEEAYSRGAKAFLGSGRKIDAAMMCEPHFEDPVTGAVGKVNLFVNVTGRSAHASHPEDGVNAVVEASKLVAALDVLPRYEHPRFGHGSHCVLGISSGERKYELRVPDTCEFLVNWQLMTGETSKDALIAIDRAIAATKSPASFAVSIREPRYESFLLDETHPLLAAFAASYRDVLGCEPPFTFGSGVSDANLFAADAGIPTILFGPGGRNLHAADEWVDLDQVLAARAVYRDFGLAFCGSARKE